MYNIGTHSIIILFLVIGRLTTFAQAAYFDAGKEYVEDKLTTSTFTVKKIKPYYLSANVTCSSLAENILVHMDGFCPDVVLHGEFVRYLNKTKQILERGYFKKGVKHGEWFMWDDAGGLLEMYQWKKGVKDGKFACYHNGQTQVSGRYKHGTLRYEYPKNNSIPTKRRFLFFKDKRVEVPVNLIPIDTLNTN